MFIKQFYRRLFYILCIVIILFSVFPGLYLVAPKPPVDLISEAREALTKAGKSKAHVYVSKQYNVASDLYDSVIIEWKKQNDRFFLKRDFKKLEELSARTIEIAERVSIESDVLIGNLETFIKEKIKALDEQIGVYDSITNKFPLPKKTIEIYTKGKLTYSEAKSAFYNKDFKLSSIKIDKAELNLNEAFSQVSKILADYFQDYNKWIDWRDETIKWSRKHASTAIIVDKCGGSCMIYQNGKLKNSFPIEMGRNWIGDKRLKGDNATPEGKYLISRKIPLRETKYYKALLINYPNSEDKKQFDKEVKNGTIPKNADIGGLIEIHGDGGKGFHWTNGCVALRNEDMDKVYSVATSGTPVTIIGSEKKLNEYFNLKAYEP